MTEIFNFSTKFTDEIITTLLAFMSLFGLLIGTLWLYNRRKFRQLSHQIPAVVIKNYLDSIIQNSNALKSSLFRGGGLEVGEGVPSVMPVRELSPGPMTSGSVNEEMLGQKNAEISSLQAKIKEKEKIIADLEKQLAARGSGDSSEEVGILQKEVARLQAELAKAKEAASSAAGKGGGDAALKQELTSVSKERDELKERLMEYEIIEEDLANLKRLQQENEQLKATIASQGGAKPVAKAEVAVESESEPEAAPVQEAEEVDEVPEAAAAPEAEEDDIPAPPVQAAAKKEAASAEADEIPAASGDGDQKSAEELLSEFEKMLG